MTMRLGDVLKHVYRNGATGELITGMTLICRIRERNACDFAAALNIFERESRALGFELVKE